MKEKSFARNYSSPFLKIENYLEEYFSLRKDEKQITNQF